MASPLEKLSIFHVMWRVRTLYLIVHYAPLSLNALYLEFPQQLERKLKLYLNELRREGWIEMERHTTPEFEECIARKREAEKGKRGRKKSYKTLRQECIQEGALPPAFVVKPTEKLVQAMEYFIDCMTPEHPERNKLNCYNHIPVFPDSMKPENL